MVCSAGFLPDKDRPAVVEMVVKTEDGWVSRKDIARKEGHYLKAHKALIAQLGPAADDPSLLKEKADELFTKIDTDKSGCICDSELKIALSEAGIELSKKEVKEFIKDFDGNG